MKHGTTKTLRVSCVLLVIFFLLCAFALLPQPVQAQTVTATVTVGSEPVGVAVSPNGEYAYVTNSGYFTNEGNSVSVISTATISTGFSLVDLSIVIIVIVIVLFLIILSLYGRRRKSIAGGVKE